MSLIAFESVARHGSVSAAAIETCLTQSAVSKQVAALERVLGERLFLRSNRGLSLTPAGEAYLAHASTALQALRSGASALMTLKRTSLRLHAVPVVGERWLMPRFSAFQQRHPSIEVQFPFFASADVHRADAAIQFGDGQWQGLTSEHLFGDEVVLAGSPALLRHLARVEAGEEPDAFHFLEHNQAGAGWAEVEAQLSYPAKPSKIVPMGFYALIIRAASMGQGLAMLPRLLIVDELERGDLAIAPGILVNTRKSYWLTYGSERRESADFQMLRDWLLAEAKGCAPAARANTGSG